MGRLRPSSRTALAEPTPMSDETWIEMPSSVLAKAGWTCPGTVLQAFRRSLRQPDTGS